MPEPASCRLRPMSRRLVFYGVLWLILSKGDLNSWPFAVAAVLLSSWISIHLTGAGNCLIRPVALLRHLPWFFWKSFVSAVDVMVRVLNPKLPISPGLILYPLTLTRDGPRVLLANCITLLPGTISARFGEDHLIVHTLDTTLPVEESIKNLERMIGAVFRDEISVQEEFP
ncbi:MAG: Na+/H+ antiporter subunit E [Proteobacteria bacterium]|nr:Na+/H+ antiporter subunit E [Pseudomonadota bacterium]MBU1738548.1 Na+/H+ antiporter subunit E [Pseudomonadota bacterium]